MKNKPRQSGNALIIVLMTIALFAALIFAFTRGTQQGTGSMNAQQARLAAQEIADFFTVVDSAVQRLRQKGCSEDDISFANSGDTGDFITENDSTTAPVDKSCHVFERAGGKVIFNMDWSKYQVTEEEGNTQHDSIYLRKINTSNVGVGTSANDLMVHFNFVKPEICVAYNKILGLDIDFSVTDAGPISGDENPDYAGKTTYCRDNTTSDFGQIRYIWVAH